MNDRNYVRLGQIYQFLQKKVNFIVDRSNDFETLISNDFDINYQLPIDSLVCQSNPQYSGNTVLHFFVEHYNEFICCKFYDKYLQMLLSRGADLNIQNIDGLTPLLLAFNFEVPGYKAKHLIHLNGKNTINFRSKSGISHFHVLCTTDNVELVELFLKAGVDINERVNEDSSKYAGCTPLHIAVQYHCIEIIKLLMKHGADLNVKDASGMTVMHSIVKIFIEAWYLKNKFFELGIFDTILKMVPDSDLRLYRFHLRCELSESETPIDKFLDDNVDIDSPIKFDSPIWPGCTPLHFAARSDDIKNITFLLEKGANLLAKDVNGTTPFDIIVKRINPDKMIEILSSEKRHQFSKLKLTDGTYLLDVIKAMKDKKDLKKFLTINTETVNASIPLNSPLWPGFNLLHLQILLGDPDYRLLNHKVDFTKLDANGMSPLHLGFRKSDWKINRWILNYHHTMPVNLIDRDNLSHLLIACELTRYKYVRDNLQPVKCLLKNKADPNISTLRDIRSLGCFNEVLIKRGTTPLHVAVKNKNPPLIKMLLSHGANPSIADADGVSPFQAGIKILGSMKIKNSGPFKKALAHMLRSHGKDLMADKNGINIMRTALAKLNYNYNELLKQIVKEFDREKRYEELGISRLQVACAAGDLFIIKQELNSGADVNAPIASDSPLCPGDTALHILLRKSKWPGNENLVELLIAHGADVSLKNAKNLTPLHLDHGYLLEKDSVLTKNNFARVNPINNEGLSHFHMCCMKDNAFLIEEFLKSGVDVNTSVDYFAKQYPGYTPLHFAIKFMQGDNIEVVELLLNYGADDNIFDANGLNPCHLAFLHMIYFDDRTKAILRCPKVNVYNPNIFGYTALDMILQNFSSYGRSTLKKNIRNILDWGYELCHKDKNGQTALHKFLNPGVINLLLKLGADMNIIDDDGKTCLEYDTKDDVKKIFIFYIHLLKEADVYLKNSIEIDRISEYIHFRLTMEKNYLNEQLQLIDPSFSIDYLFSERFVVDYKKIPVSQRKAIKSDNFSNLILYPIIMLQLRKARARIRLLQPAEVAFQALTGRSIPDCVEFIFNYLDYDDLMNLVRADNEKLIFSPIPENFE